MARKGLKQSLSGKSQNSPGGQGIGTKIIRAGEVLLEMKANARIAGKLTGFVAGMGERKPLDTFKGNI